MKIITISYACNAPGCEAEFRGGPHEPAAEVWASVQASGWTQSGTEHFCWAHSIVRQALALPPAPYYVLIETTAAGESIIDCWPRADFAQGLCNRLLYGGYATLDAWNEQRRQQHAATHDPLARYRVLKLEVRPAETAPEGWGDDASEAGAEAAACAAGR